MIEWRRVVGLLLGMYLSHALWRIRIDRKVVSELDPHSGQTLFSFAASMVEYPLCREGMISGEISYLQTAVNNFYISWELEREHFLLISLVFVRYGRQATWFEDT